MNDSSHSGGIARMKGESNTDWLNRLGVLDPSDMHEDHIKVVNEEMTPSEVYAILLAHTAVKNRIPGAVWRPDVNAFGF